MPKQRSDFFIDASLTFYAARRLQMLVNGSKIPHVKSPNFISEMADSFNVAGLQTGSGSKISMIISRDQLDVTQETLVQQEIGFQAQVQDGDLVLTKHVVANITIPLDSAKALVIALQTAIDQIPQAPSPTAPPNTTHG
ncbi:hypothetical protein [Pseudomonas sp. LB3P58]